ncbi:MAG: MotE family protein [Vulcanimicrobiaceae bacterium]
MIVTRQRRKAFPWRRILLPLIALGLVAFAVAWPPSRNEIVNGPLAPVWRASAPMAGTITAPFHFAAQNQAMTGLKHQIVQLQSQVTAARNSAKSKDRQIAKLQSQVVQLESQAATRVVAKPGTSASSASPIAAGSAAIGAGTAAQAGPASGDLSAGATPDMRRTAQYWANMEPENAAKVVQKLPTAYVARVMSLMSPDAAGAILDALPAAVAARLTQEHPELRR